MYVTIKDVNPDKIEYLKVFKVRIGPCHAQQWDVLGIEDGFFILKSKDTGEMLRSNKIWLV